MPNLRAAARGRECQVRFVGICNGNPETTVLAHVRLAGVTGAGQKSPDQLGSWSCSACHAEADRRTALLDRDAALLGFYEGVIRTLSILIKEGKVK